MRIQKEQELQSEQITRKQAEEKISYLEKDVLEQQQKIQKLEQQQKDNEQQIKQEQQKKDKAENRIIKLEKENKIEHWKLNNMEDRAQIAEKTMKIVNEENMKLTQILYPPRNDQEEQYKIEQEKRRLSFIESIQDRFVKYSKQAYDKVNHYTEILKDYAETIKGKILGKDQIPWDQIANELLYGEQRDQNEWQTIVERKEWYCRTIISSMNEQDQEQKIEAMINSSVVNSLYNIFITQDNDTFSQSCTDAFIQLSKYGQVQSKLDIDTHSRISDIIANLYSRNLRVIKQSLNSIFLIIRHEVQITPSTEPYSHFLDFEQYGAIDQFYKVFQDNDNSDIKNMASLCIGQLQHARRFEDDDMKEQIINYLTALSKIEDDNSVVQKSAMQTLKNLLPYQCMLIFVKKRTEF